MYYGIYDKSTGLIDHYKQAKGYLEIDEYIRSSTQPDHSAGEVFPKTSN